MVLDLPIVPDLFPFQYPEEILIELLSRVIQEVNMTFESLKLLPPPSYYLEELLPIKLHRLDYLDSVINKLLLDYLVNHKVLF